jgi:hypothetical protein
MRWGKSFILLDDLASFGKNVHFNSDEPAQSTGRGGFVSALFDPSVVPFEVLREDAQDHRSRCSRWLCFCISPSSPNNILSEQADHQPLSSVIIYLTEAAGKGLLPPKAVRGPRIDTRPP